MTALQLRGTLLVALSGALFGTIGYLGMQLLYLHLSIENMLFWRFFLASLGLLLGLGVFQKHTLLKNYSPMRLLKIFIWGSISYTTSAAAYFMSSQHIGTGLAMVLLFSFPMFVGFFAWALGRWRINFYAALSLIAMMIGLICLKGPSANALAITGILLGLLSAVAYAVYVYNSKYHTHDIDAQWLTFLVCFGNAIIFFSWSYTTDSLTLPQTLDVWFYLLLIAIFATVLPIWLLLEGLKYISPVKASIVSVSEPIVTLLIGATFLNEILTPLQMIGVVTILVAAVMIQFERSPNDSA